MSQKLLRRHCECNDYSREKIIFNKRGNKRQLPFGFKENPELGNIDENVKYLNI